jgi:hypothetical protein
MASGLLAGCEISGSDQQAASSCSAGSAAIGVSDGLIAVLCGCDESGGAWQTFDTGLTCTVRPGTTVVFHYLGTRLRHQIITTPSSASAFSPSPISDPIEDPGIRAHAVTLTTGTYTFTDAFDSRLASTLVVAP